MMAYPESSDLLDTIREACQRVAARARFVRLEETRLAALARELIEAREEAPPDPAHLRRGSPEVTLAFVLTLDAINFGSGWFPCLRKRPGHSGYFTVALSLADHFEAHGPWSARQLVALDAVELAGLFGQDLGRSEVAELLELYARALHDLGAFLLERYGGDFHGPVEEAGGSAAQLVEILTSMPFYRDVASYEGIEVPFYKRAQITASDLYFAFDGQGPGRVHDVDRLTLFADNLVPHVLRLAGLLVYDPELLGRIERGELIPAGSLEEIEIRAVAVHGVERLVESIRQRGGSATAQQLDELLWARGQRPSSKAEPRHRTRTVYY